MLAFRNELMHVPDIRPPGDPPEDLSDLNFDPSSTFSYVLKHCIPYRKSLDPDSPNPEREEHVEN